MSTQSVYPGWLSRLRSEFHEVNVRAKRLETFLDNDAKASAVGTQQLRLMRAQRSAMAGYVAILKERIDLADSQR